MNPSIVLRLSLVGFLSGVLLSVQISALLSFLVLVLGAVACFNFQHRATILWLFIGLGCVYGVIYNALFYPPALKPLVGQTLVFNVEVQGEPRFSRSGVQTVRLKLNSWKELGADNLDWQSINGKVLWQRSPLPALNSGDDLVVKATLTNLSNFSDDFDAQLYWSRWGISEQFIRGTVIERPEFKSPVTNQFRSLLAQRLENMIAKPHLTIALGMLIGLKEKLPPALEDDFKASGLQHLLVVSGTNVTLLILALGLLLKPLGPWYKYAIGMACLLFYLCLVGFEPPALRATLFGIITGFALTSGLKGDYQNIFLSVATIITLSDPRFLTHDISFWLSFGATAGIIFGFPVIWPALSFLKYKPLKLLLGASFCAQMSVFPILITQFGSFPYAGLLTNLVTEPLVPMIMFLAFGGMIIGPLSLLGLEFLWQIALELSLSSLILVAQVGASVPEIIIPVWGGAVWLVLFIIFLYWALVSQHYKIHYWLKFEREMSGCL